jgi:hypothetical protein
MAVTKHYAKIGGANRSRMIAHRIGSDKEDHSKVIMAHLFQMIESLDTRPLVSMQARPSV